MAKRKRHRTAASPPFLIVPWGWHSNLSYLQMLLELCWYNWCDEQKLAYNIHTLGRADGQTQTT